MSEVVKVPQRLSLTGGIKREFNYEGKLWGGNQVGLRPTYLGALRLKYCLDDLKSISGRVVEVGCGGGGMVKAIKRYRPDLTVYGCDLSQTAIKLAQKEARGVNFLVGNTYRLPFKDDFFDALVTFDLLEHLDEPGQAIREFRRILKPGGLFHSFVPCEGSFYTFQGILTRLGWRAKEIYAGHNQRFTRSQLVTLIQKGGLKLTKSRWDVHLFNQLVDTLYFIWLSWRKKNVSSSVETYLASAEPSGLRQTISFLKGTIALGSYLESRWLSWLPGAGVHLTGLKEKTKN